jgi:o-succinylbenzoate---CoA ligase
MNWIERQALRQGHHRALTDGERRWTFEEMYRDAATLAEFLQHGAGIGSGDLVCLFPAQRPEDVLWIHALMMIDAVIMPVSARYTDAESDALVARLLPDAVVYHSEPDIGRIMPAPDVADMDVQAPEVGGRRRVRVSRAQVRQRSFEIPGGTTAILASSGSGGEPKLAPITRAMIEASARASVVNLGAVPDENWLCVIPLAHVGGLVLVMRAAIDGACATILPRFDETRVLRAMRTERVTVASFVPTMLARLMAHDASFDAANYPALRAILLGGAPSDNALLARAVERRLPVLLTYGLTEACSQVATMRPGEAPRAGCAGRPLEGVSVRILDDHRMDAATDAIGGIWIRGPVVMPAYLHPTELNAASFMDGWYFTGDKGRLDADGRLWIAGRSDAMILTGGENVYPEEIEAIVGAHPCVADVAVTGVVDAVWGQALIAYVVLAPTPAGMAADSPVYADISEELLQYCRGRLAGYKIPRRWVVVESIPRNASGKIVRSALSSLAGSGES